MKKHTDLANTFFTKPYIRVAFVVLGGLLLVSLYGNYVSYTSSRLGFFISNFLNKHELLNPSIAVTNRSDLIVNFNSLAISLQKKYENHPDFMVGLYFEYQPTGANINLNKDERVWPASLIKIPVAMAVMKKVERGVWKLDNELVILDEDKDSEYGELYKEPTGTTMTIERLLYESVVNSDNTAHFVLLRNLDTKELEDVYTSIGLDDVIDTLKTSPEEEELDNRITAKRYTIFFRALYNATYLNPEYSQLFLSILKDSPLSYLQRGLPDDILFLHKTGIRTDDRVWADSGIVYVPGRPYLLTVMIQKKGSGDPKEGEVEGMFKDISQEIYEFVSKAR